MGLGRAAAAAGEAQQQAKPKSEAQQAKTAAQAQQAQAQPGAGSPLLAGLNLARVQRSEQFTAHLLAAPPASPPPHNATTTITNGTTSTTTTTTTTSSGNRLEAATVVGRHHLATYAREGHAAWKMGDKVQAIVHCPVENRRVGADAVVVFKSPVLDLAILEVQRELSAPVLDCALSLGEGYYMLGQPAQPQPALQQQQPTQQPAQGQQAGGPPPPVSCRGLVAATELDAHCHIRGDVVAGEGDCGGGCFSVATGRLIGLAVGPHAHKEEGRVALIPIAAIAGLLVEIAPC
ncbi:hypothetical protein HXX76_010920 [Chlamydomonas incerta]|uniref:Uncharacterized protein n=1 Tax=Chlamydomonas incerta TaxID=51695 RepID=A0A835SP85_CHLIN|nr:hypothetical protein HXX76_010920 [Chlamydomonas incerta]|eukprot:KAG2427203.1 hypothetical protein HXX76_010920 [Chlamydomonas incerta]